MLRVLLALMAVAIPRFAHAQISPPGLGDAQTATWTALGIKQSLDASERREYASYVGFGSTSEHSALNPYAHPNIFVFNHEFTDRFVPRWQYSVGLSYRRQESYERHEGLRSEKRIHEARLYARFSSVHEHGRLKLVNTVRPELRGFARLDFARAAEPVQLRLRFKSQVGCKLDGSGVHRLMAAAEALASSSREAGREAGWSRFDYRESRFSLFYSMRVSEQLMVDLGYMNDVLGTQAPLADVHYLAIDIIWLDPFHQVER